MGLNSEMRLYLDQLASDWDEGMQTHADKLALLDNDYQRYQYCRRKWLKYKRKWWDGQRNSVRATLLSGDARFEHETPEARITIGKQRWGKSPEAKELADLEQMWGRWMLTYADLSDRETARKQRQMERLGMHRRTA